MDEKAAPEYSEQVQILREFSRRFGFLHEAQKLQLQLWPMVAFSHAISSEAHVDLEGRSVTFEIKAKGRSPARMADRARELTSATRFLLGDDYKVKIKINGKLQTTKPPLKKVALKIKGAKKSKR